MKKKQKISQLALILILIEFSVVMYFYFQIQSLIKENELLKKIIE
jgi:hypothetical protein